MANTSATPEKEEKTVVAEKVVTQEENEHEHKTCCSRQKKFVYVIAGVAFFAFTIATYAAILSIKCACKLHSSLTTSVYNK
jgi:translation initiation factor 1 (eIF-1/SUI1)